MTLWRGPSAAVRVPDATPRPNSPDCRRNRL